MENIFQTCRQIYWCWAAKTNQKTLGANAFHYFLVFLTSFFSALGHLHNYSSELCCLHSCHWLPKTVPSRQLAHLPGS